MAEERFLAREASNDRDCWLLVSGQESLKHRKVSGLTRVNAPPQYLRWTVCDINFGDDNIDNNVLPAFQPLSNTARFVVVTEGS